MRRGIVLERSADDRAHAFIGELAHQRTELLFDHLKPGDLGAGGIEFGRQGLNLRLDLADLARIGGVIVLAVGHGFDNARFECSETIVEVAERRIGVAIGQGAFEAGCDLGQAVLEPLLVNGGGGGIETGSNEAWRLLYAGFRGALALRNEAFALVVL